MEHLSDKELESGGFRRVDVADFIRKYEAPIKRLLLPGIEALLQLVQEGEEEEAIEGLSDRLKASLAMCLLGAWSIETSVASVHALFTNDDDGDRSRANVCAQQIMAFALSYLSGIVDKSVSDRVRVALSWSDPK